MRNFLQKWYAIFMMTVLGLVAKAETPSAPPGTNIQSWLGNTFSAHVANGSEYRVPEELEDIKLGSGTVFFDGYHERGGGVASFNSSSGSFAGRYDGFGSGFGIPFFVSYLILIPYLSMFLMLNNLLYN